MLVECLLHLHRQTPNSAVVEIARQSQGLLLLGARDFVLLARDVALVLRLDLDLLGDSRVDRGRLTGLRKVCERGEGHAGTLEQVHERVLPFDRFAEHSIGELRAK